MSRITLQDTSITALIKCADGNPGALTVMMRLLKETELIDPDSAMGGIGEILDLDDAGIYGSEIWMLYKDVCGEDLVKMVGLLRARQLGFISTETIIRAIQTRQSIDVDSLIVRVKAKLPLFVDSIPQVKP